MNQASNSACDIFPHRNCRAKLRRTTKISNSEMPTVAASRTTTRYTVGDFKNQSGLKLLMAMNSKAPIRKKHSKQRLTLCKAVCKPTCQTLYANWSSRQHPSTMDCSHCTQRLCYSPKGMMRDHRLKKYGSSGTQNYLLSV